MATAPAERVSFIQVGNVPPQCIWRLDSDPDGGDVWETSCGHAFQFTEAGPKENQFAYCGYCGGKLVELTTTARPDDDDRE